MKVQGGYTGGDGKPALPMTGSIGDAQLKMASTLIREKKISDQKLANLIVTVAKHVRANMHNASDDEIADYCDAQLAHAGFNNIKVIRLR